MDSERSGVLSTAVFIVHPAHYGFHRHVGFAVLENAAVLQCEPERVTRLLVGDSGVLNQVRVTIFFQRENPGLKAGRESPTPGCFFDGDCRAGYSTFTPVGD